MTGCLIALGILLVIVIAGVVFVMLSWRGWVASGLDAASEGVVAEMGLDEAEEGEVLAELQAVTGAFKDGDISFNDGIRVLEEIAKSPVAPTLMVGGLHAQYFEPSGLSDEEKESAKVALSRVGRGVYEGSIEADAINGVFEPISTTATSGQGVHINTEDFSLNLKPPADVTDEELRAVIALAEQQATDAEIPDEMHEIDASEEIAKAVEAALGRRLTPAPAAEEGEGP